MPEIINLFASNLSLFLNTLELIALAASAITFFILMFNKYNKGLKAVLSPCGLGVWARLKVLFICRKSVLKKRAFIEFAILKTQGYSTVSGEWKTIINEFKTFYNENRSELVYSIPNCTVLLGKNFSCATERYFNYINDKKVKKTFGIRESVTGWVIKIRIEEAYATPSCLLTGLLSKYEENWEEFIKRYVSTAYISENVSDPSVSILTSELYFTFDWLLWGPSYELDYRNCWAGLCQISYGDESNSLPAVADMNSDVMERLREKFDANEERRYGALLTTDITIYEKKAYYKKIREFTNPENLYFYDKTENGEFSFAAQIDEYSPCMNFKAKKYYCTAYVWLLFEIEDDSSPEFHPEKCVAFFEHANLTDKNAYNFLIKTLIDKSLKHFEEILSKPEFAGRRYRFVTAFNDKIAAECKEIYSKIVASGSSLGDTIEKHVIMESKRPPFIVFSAFDNFFAQSNKLDFVHVKAEEKNSISDLAAFYTDVYLECFTDENERESFDNIMWYLKHGENHPEYVYHILVAKDENGSVVGGAIFDYFKKTNSAVIEFIAVKPNLQACGKGTAIYKQVLAMLSYDANKNKFKNVENIFCEAETPEKNVAPDKKYLNFWHKNNFKRLEFGYVQPALSTYQKPVEDMWLTVTAPKQTGEFQKDKLLKFLQCYMKYCMRIDEPEKNEHYKKMKLEIENKNSVLLKNII